MGGAQALSAIVDGETRFVGRERELEELAGLLAATRLLTVTGAGGAGKTRLALAAADRAGAAAAGPEVVVAMLAGLPSGELVLGTVLDAAGVSERPGQDRLHTLAERFADGDVLLMLDNCEHLSGAVAEVIESLLRRSPGLRVLATSRTPLEIAGEVTWRTPPLARADAVVLFLDRARRAAPGFDLADGADVAGLCDELDGQPLAIELAAARVPDQPIEQIAAGLRDHDTIEASIEWSCAQLGESERTLLRRLAVLSGWTLPAVAAVAEYPDPAASLGRLVRAGLVAVARDGGSERYAMPEPVRQYALARLRDSGEEQLVRGRHASHFGELARRADELLDQLDGSYRLEREAPNLIGALDHALAANEVTALEMVAGLGLWWVTRDRFSEGRGVCARALAALAGRDPRSEALVRWVAAQLAFHALDLAEAHTQGALALALAESSGDDRAIGRCLQMMAAVLGTSDPMRGAELGRRSVELLRRAGDRHGLAHALVALATAEGQCDQFEAARAACAEFEAVGAGRAHRWLRTWMEITLAWAADFEGDIPAALAHSDAALALAGGEPTLVRCYALFSRALALVRGGRADTAQAELTAGVETAVEAGFEVAAPILQYPLAVTELAHGRLASARERISPLIDERHLPGAASSHELLAIVALAGGDPDAAGEHAAALRRVAARTGSDRRAGLADLFDGIATLQRGPSDRAADLLHAALARLLDHGFRRDATLALEALGALAASEADAEAAARLLGAVAASRRLLGCVRVPLDEPWLESLRERAQAALGPSDWATAWAGGESLTLDEAANYAARGRGKRRRALGGWESLTPTEADVARLAADGLTNPQIGERMFISRGTVKAHLAHIYDKLGVSNRTELATVAARRREPAHVRK